MARHASPATMQSSAHLRDDSVARKDPVSSQRRVTVSITATVHISAHVQPATLPPHVRSQSCAWSPNLASEAGGGEHAAAAANAAAARFTMRPSPSRPPALLLPDARATERGVGRKTAAGRPAARAKRSKTMAARDARKRRAREGAGCGRSSASRTRPYPRRPPRRRRAGSRSRGQPTHDSYSPLLRDEIRM